MIKKKIIEAIKNTVRKSNLHEPFFIGKEIKYLKQCILNNSVSSSKVFFKKKFEDKIKKLTGARYIVLTNSGTSALHLSLIASGVSKNEEVLMPSLNYIASANTALYCNAIPHFIDINRLTLGVDCDRLESYLSNILVKKGNFFFNKNTNRVVKTLICLHTFGHPCEIDRILNICKKYNITLIEDAAESLGSFYKKKHLGIFGKIGVLSFNGNKIVTCGSGGAIITKSKSIYILAKHLSEIGKIPHLYEYNYNRQGYNYVMSNLNASLGFAQIEKINYFIKLKRNLFKRYEKSFSAISKAHIFREPKYARSNYWLNTIVLSESNMKLRNKIINELNILGYVARPVWQLLHTVSYLKNFPKDDLQTSLEMRGKIINIPSSAFL
jgi:perosamine synthetase